MTALDATQLVLDVQSGDARAADALLPLVYERLRELAGRYLRREGPGHTLQPSALVHEAYLRMVDQKRVDWKGRTHFCAIAAKMMQRVLLDHAKGRKRAKRGGGWRQITLSGIDGRPGGTTLDALAEVMERLRELDERQHAIVELRYLGGMSMEEVAEHLGVSKRTAEREWTFAKTWLQKELSKGETR